MHDDSNPGAVEADQSIFGLPVDTALLVSDEKGTGTRTINKKRRQLLEKAGFLVRFLEPYEKVVFITTGCSPSTERERQCIGSTYLPVAKRALFVFTDRRVFHIPVTPKDEFRGSIAQIRYADCRRLSVERTTFVAEYQTASKERFTHIPKGDGPLISQVNMDAPEPSGSSPCAERHHICPKCMHRLRLGMVACPGCGLEFKSPVKAWRYAVLFPGGGHFYLRRWGQAIGRIFGESFILGFALLSLYLAISDEPAAILGFIAFGLFWAHERLADVYSVGHLVAEFIPVDLKSFLAEQDASSEPKREPMVEEVLPAGREGKG